MFFNISDGFVTFFQVTPKKKAECYIFATFCLNFFLQHRTSLLPEFSFQSCPVSLVYQAIFHQDLLLRPVFSLLPHTVCCSSSATVSVSDEVPLYDTDMLPDSLILAPSSIFCSRFSSRVVAPNSRSSFLRLWFRQATISFLCTSIPQQMS